MSDFLVQEARTKHSYHLVDCVVSDFHGNYFFQTVEEYIGKFLGFTGEGKEGTKKELLTFLGVGMGGVQLGIQATIANNRANLWKTLQMLR